MTQYGIRVKDDTTRDTLLLTPDLFSVVSSGRVDMPASGISGQTYGASINLPGTSAYKEVNIGIIVTPYELNIDVLLTRSDAGGLEGGAYAFGWCMHDDTFTFYTRNESTGVLTTWTPADDAGDDETWDSILAIYPVAFWDKRGATTFTSVSIFAAMCYEVYDKSASSFIKAYAVGSQGVEHVDYAVLVRHYSEE